MDKKDFLIFLTSIFKPLGYKRKDKSWYFETEELKKVINLQKSDYSNLYYIRGGFMIKKIDNQNLLFHIPFYFGSSKKKKMMK